MATEIATAFVALVPSFKGGQGAITKELSGAGGAAGAEAGKKTGSAMGGAILGGLRGIAGPMAAIFAGLGVVSFVKESVGAASDLNETISKSNVIFGENAGAVQNWAKSAAKNFGLSRQEALETRASFGDMFRQIGFSGDEAFATSGKVVQLATDLGSFNNLPTADVAERISAAFRGEFDSLQAVIPNISAARVEQEALNATGKKSADTLTAQEKAQAVLNIVQKDGIRAQGDFARTSGGLANQQKILTAQWADFKTTLGSALLPVVTKVVTKFNEWLPTIVRIGQQVGGWLKDAFATIAPLVKAFWNGLQGGTAGGSGALVTVTNAGNALRDAFFTLLPYIQQFGDLITTKVIPAVQQAATWLLANRAEIEAWAVAALKVAAVAIPIFLAFKTIVGGINLATAAFQAMKLAMATNPFTLIIAAVIILAVIIVKNWDTIKAFLAKTWEWIKSTAASIWNGIKAFFTGLVSGIVKFFQDRWNKAKTDTINAFNAIKSKVTSILTSVRTFISEKIAAIVGFFKALPGKVVSAVTSFGSKLLGTLKSGMTTAARGITDGITRMIGFLKELPGKAVSAVGNLGRSLLGAGKSLIQGLIDGITQKFRDLKNKLSEVTSFLPDWKGPPKKDAKLLTPNGELIMGGLMRGIENQVPALKSTLQGITSDIPGRFATPFVPGAQDGLDGSMGSIPEVRVFIGDKELKGIIRTEVSESNRATKTRVVTGSGRL